MGTMRLFKVWLLICLMVLSGGSLAFAQTNTFPSSGDVGIGTTNPDPYKLFVNTTGTDFLRLRTELDAGRSLIVEYDNQGGSDGAIKFDTDVTKGYAFIGGNVGIGTTSPATKFHVGGVGADTASARFVGGASNLVNVDVGFRGSTGYIGTQSDHNFEITTNNAEGRFRITNSGNVGIGTTSPSSKLHVAGDATIDGNIAAKYQDVAEWVRTPTRLAPGTVVVIDPQENNQVLPASQAYDTRVAGVVSAQPGIILGEAAEDKAKVAHSGRVKVKADARFGSIETGDLLVSSATTGYAMRSTPIEISGTHIHRPGTIVGKALEPLKEGQGEILVFLTLQ